MAACDTGDVISSDQPVNGDCLFPCRMWGKEYRNLAKCGRHGSWNNVEESSSCAFVANRSFGFDTADSSNTASDTVAAWEGVGSC